jgi:hypothetical protein
MYPQPAAALSFRSASNQRGICSPILTSLHFYRIQQHVSFVYCPFPRTPECLVNAGIRETTPSATTLTSSQTLQEEGDCILILAIVHLYRILQLGVFI